MGLIALQYGADVLTRAYDPIRNDLRAAERIFDGELVSEFGFINELCVRVRSYRGKMLRPALLLLSAGATGGVGSAHRTLAAVVEMVHMATLVHDDVLDEAEHRRGEPTVKTLAGNTAAVLLGDYLISHAFHLCSSLDNQYASRRIGATTNCVCEGELLQNMHRGNLDLCERDYFDIIRRKTGALTAVACELGASFASDADRARSCPSLPERPAPSATAASPGDAALRPPIAAPDTARAMYEYGMSVGVAFQIVDDVLDLVGDEALMGKTLRLDFALGKPTLPLIHCLANGDTATIGALRRIWEQRFAGPDMTGSGGGPAAGELRGVLDRTGSLDFALAVGERYVASAVAALSALPPSPARDSLRTLAQFITRRSV